MTNTELKEKLLIIYDKFDWEGFNIEDIFDEILKLSQDIDKLEENPNYETEVDFDLIERGLSALNMLREKYDSIHTLCKEAKKKFVNTKDD